MYYFSILYSFPPFIFQGGHFWVKFRSMKLKMTTSGPVPDNKRPRAGVKLKIYHAERRAISAWADRPAEMTASRPPVEVLRASSYTPRVSMARFARGLPQLGRAAHGLLRGRVAGSM